MATIAAIVTITISSEQLLNAYNVPGIVLNVLFVLYHLINKAI